MQYVAMAFSKEGVVFFFFEKLFYDYLIKGHKTEPNRNARQRVSHVGES